MGNIYSSWESAPKNSDQEKIEYLLSKSHKIYVITTPSCGFVKVGYTGSSIINGVWKPYRRSYGEDMKIIRIFPANNKLEDLDIHRDLIPKYGMKGKGKEIYDKRHLHRILSYLEKRFQCEGYGPYEKTDLQDMKVKTITDVYEVEKISRKGTHVNKSIVSKTSTYEPISTINL